MFDLLRIVIESPESVIPFAAASSALAAVMALAWPYLWPDRLDQRIAGVQGVERRLATRAQRALDGVSEHQRLRRSAPRPTFRAIVDALNLSAKLDDPELGHHLQRAGFRGRHAAVQFLALRVLCALAGAPCALFYTYAVLGLSYPLPVHLAIAAVVGALGYGGPALYIKNRITKRQHEIRRNWPDALDLMLICVESGMAIEGAFRKVAQEMDSAPSLAEELMLTTAELSYLGDRRAALEGLGRRTDLDGVRNVVTTLIQSEKYGTPLARALKVLAQEGRDQRMAAAEKKAAGLPPKLTVPMIIFFLPVLFAAIMSPAIMDIF